MEEMAKEVQVRNVKAGLPTPQTPITYATATMLPSPLETPSPTPVSYVRQNDGEANVASLMERIEFLESQLKASLNLSAETDY